MRPLNSSPKVASVTVMSSELQDTRTSLTTSKREGEIGVREWHSGTLIGLLIFQSKFTSEPSTVRAFLRNVPFTGHFRSFQAIVDFSRI